jgi:hypothetical protein
MAYPSHNLKAVRPAAGPNEHNPELCVANTPIEVIQDYRWRVGIRVA